MEKTKPTDDIGARVRLERTRLNVSQQLLAERAGVSINTQMAYEQGVRVPNISYLKVVSDLGMDAWFIAFGIPVARASVQHIDWQFVEKIEIAIREWEGDSGRVIPAHKRADLKRLLYQASHESHEFADTDFERAINLVA